MINHSAKKEENFLFTKFKLYVHFNSYTGTHLKLIFTEYTNHFCSTVQQKTWWQTLNLVKVPFYSFRVTGVEDGQTDRQLYIYI